MTSPNRNHEISSVVFFCGKVSYLHSTHNGLTFVNTNVSPLRVELQGAGNLHVSLVNGIPVGL